MFKPSPRAILVATVTFLAASALPVAFAKGGNGHHNGGSGSSGSSGSTSDSNGGGPPACRDLQPAIDSLQHSVTTLSTTVNTMNATVAATNATVNTLSSRIDTITANLDDLQSSVDDIAAALQAAGLGSLQASVSVDETVCVSGATQCSSATAANSTNQNPVTLTVLVMKGNAPVTNLTSSNFTLTTDFGPGGQPANLVLCTSGDTGCGTGSFVVNSGSGGYQLWVSPTSNWLPGTYTAQLKVTDTTGAATTQLVKITIPS